MAERPEDLNLPNSVVSKIIKEALPEGVNVSKDARLAISKAASVFVLYSTSCANNFAMQHKRKTISGQDVLDAMKEMEFERFVEPLKRSLEAYKEQKTRKEQPADSRSKKDAETTSTEPLETITTVINDDDDVEEIPDDDSPEVLETETETATS